MGRYACRARLAPPLLLLRKLYWFRLSRSVILREETTCVMESVPIAYLFVYGMYVFDGYLILLYLDEGVSAMHLLC